MKESYIKRYEETLRDYFDDGTEQGRIAKYAKSKEQEYVLETVFGVSYEDIKAIHDKEYRRAREENKR